MITKVDDHLKSDDTFQSLGTVSPTASSADLSDEENRSPSSSPQQQLVEENERLKAEIAELKLAMSKLQDSSNKGLPAAASSTQIKEQQQQQQQQRLHPQTIQHLSQPKLVLELPEMLRRGSQPKNGKVPPVNYCIRKPLKEELSGTTDDDQETIGPDFDIEAHESSKGLHHRAAHLLNPAHPMSPTQRRSKILVSTSKEDDTWNDEDDDDANNHNIERRNLLLRRSQQQQHATDAVVPPTASVLLQEESFLRVIQDRAGWLVGLLVLQSMSSFILARNEELLAEHMVIIRFLTMLVGAGGNAGNQASVRVIRGLAVGTINESNSKIFLRREFKMGLALSGILGIAGCVRAALFLTPLMETIAITSSLFMIVIISVVLGALLPLGMQLVGIDPAHSSTTIQVFMDILGVTITVHVSRFILDSDFSWLSFGGSFLGDA